MVKWVSSTWDENAATAGAIVFIPCLLVAASLFPSQITYSDSGTPCYWLFVDAVILCFTIAVVAACIDFAADLYCFFQKVAGDSVPMIVGKDYTHEYPQTFSSEIFFALLIRVIGSTFILLVLTSAISFALLPLNGTPPANSTNINTGPTPQGCDMLSSKVYHFQLFFGFAVVSVVFAILRFAFVHQSKHHQPPGHEHGHSHGGHDHHHDNDEHTQELAVVKTEGERESHKKDEEDGSEEENTEEREEKKRRRRERREKRREKREKKKKERKDSDDDEPEQKDEGESENN